MDYGRRNGPTGWRQPMCWARCARLPALRGALLPAHPALRETVEGWRLQLEPMSLSVVAPPDRVWQQIRQAPVQRPAPAPDEAPARWWQLLPWRALSGSGESAAALGMAVLMLQPPSRRSGRCADRGGAGRQPEVGRRIGGG